MNTDHLDKGGQPLHMATTERIWLQLQLQPNAYKTSLLALGTGWHPYPWNY